MNERIFKTFYCTHNFTYSELQGIADGLQRKLSHIYKWIKPFYRGYAEACLLNGQWVTIDYKGEIQKLRLKRNFKNYYQYSWE